MTNHISDDPHPPQSTITKYFVCMTEFLASKLLKKKGILPISVHNHAAPK